MKVALSFPECHRRGGVERIVLECARFLAGRDHQVMLYTNKYEGEAIENLQVHHVPMRHRPAFLAGTSYFHECTKALQGADYDVLNTHGCVCPTGGVYWVQSVARAWLEQSQRMRAPLSLSRWKQRLNPLHPALIKLEEKHFGERNYKKIIVTTPQVRADIHRLYHVPLEDVEIIPNGFHPLEFNVARRLHNRAEQRDALGLGEDDIALLFVANELERKGYPAILSALSQLKNPRFKLLAVGRPDVALVRAMAETAGVSDQVIACGATSEIANFHAAADIFVLPTQYEAFCLAILEALGSGLPVVTTRVPGAHDAIQEGVNGLLMDDPRSGEQLAQLLERLLDDRDRDRLAAAAAASVEEFQWPRVLERYERVLLANCG